MLGRLGAVSVALLLISGGATAQVRPLRPAASQLFLPAPVLRETIRDSTSANGALDGALLGAGIGGALGALLGAAACEDNCSFPERTRSAFGVLLIGAAVGALIGAIFGST